MNAKRKQSKFRSKSGSRLSELRIGLTSEQQRLLEKFWQHYREHSKWPLTRTIHSQDGKRHVREALHVLSPDVAVERTDNSSGNRYELTLIGVLLTEKGDEYCRLLIRYLDFLREQFHRTPEKLDFSDKDFGRALNLSEEEVVLLGKLVTLGYLSKGGSSSATGWTIRVPDEVEDLPSKGGLNKALEDLLFRQADSSKPVVTANWPFTYLEPYPHLAYGPAPMFGGSTPSTITVDALKRRYQVFVSSTYEDLKEERQHVIQSLLETKCIPLGMELFPAASIEQWELIKRVIDECDYYIVIIAGRYGSLNESSVSYTEMEFDYALSVGKPVIGFYHKDVDSLPGSKLENTDQARKRLRQFTEKVKKRLCRPWSSAAELGSAVKSAVISELEFNPKPGWIRADAVPSSDAVDKLKQRIADLEEKIKKQRTAGEAMLPEGRERVSIPVDVGYEFGSENIVSHLLAKKHFSHNHVATWDDLILVMEAGLQQGSTLQELHEIVSGWIYEALPGVVAGVLKKPKPTFSYSVEEEDIDIILKTLAARKLVRMVPRYMGRLTSLRWRFTPQGLQYLAELQAIRSAS